VKPDFISIMHQMQKMTSLTGVRTLVQETGNLAQLGRQDALDKLNIDVIVDEIASITGVKPEMVLSQDEVQAIRKARADQQKAMQQGQAMAEAAKGAKNLSAVDPTKLQDVAQSLAPVAAAQGGYPQLPGASA
jgi:hypothetical protein